VSRERARQIREAGEKQLRADFIVLALWQSLMARR
jgi:RNA polymerase sigma factor for flagellar operon FliA